MSRRLITIHSDVDRTRVATWAIQAPTGTRVEFKASKRTLPQNDRMWAMLTDVARQATHFGKKLTPDTWKVLFMHALKKEVQFLPSLNGQELVPLGYRSSELSKAEMSDLIEFIHAWGAENEIKFNDPVEQAA